MTPILVQIAPFDLKTALRTTVRAGDSPVAHAYGLNGVQWLPALTERPGMSIELMAPELDGKVMAGRTRFTLDLKALGMVAKETKWIGAEVFIYSAAKMQWPAVTEFNGLITGHTVDVDRENIAITAEVDTTFLEGPLLIFSFGGGGGLDGDADKRGTLFPAGFGACENIPPVWFDSTTWIGMIDGYANCTAITRLMEGLDDRGARVADYANYAALKNAIDTKAIKPGQWGTCVAQGLVGLGAPPAAPITVNATFGSNRAGAWMKRLLQVHRGVAIGNIDTAAFDAMDVAVNRPTHWWTADQRDVKDLIEAIACSINATPLVDFTKKVTITRGVVSASLGTLDRSGASLPRVMDSKAAEPRKPVYRLRARCARPASTLTYDEVLYEDTIEDKGAYNVITIYRKGHVVWSADKSSWLYINATPTAGNAPPAWPTAANAYWQNMTPPVTSSSMTYADGTPIENLKPAQIGANVTQTNTAAAILGQTALATATVVPATFLNLVPGNRIRDPLFADNAYWTMIGNAVFDTTTANFAALPATKAITNTIAGNSNWRNLREPVLEGKTYQFGFQVLLKAGYNSNIIVNCRWYNRLGVSIGTGVGKYHSYTGAGAAVAADTLIIATFNAIAPAGAAFAALEPLCQTTAANQYYAAQPFIVEVASTTQVDLGNTANMIQDPNLADPTAWATTANVTREANVTNGEGAGRYKFVADITAAGSAVTNLIECPPDRSFFASTYEKLRTAGVGTLACQLQWYKADGTASSVTANSTVYSNSTGASGRFSAVVKSPSDAAFVRFRWFWNAGGAGGRVFELSEPMLRPAITLNYDIVLEDGTTKGTNNLLQTSLGTAAAITGQQAWATYSGLVPANVAGQVQNLSTGGALGSISNITNRRLTLLLRADGTTALTEADAITSLGTAASISGQAAWATYSGLVPANVAGQVQNLSTGGALSSLSNVTNRRLTLLLRDDGTTALTEAASITALGTAAAIAGQQAWATYSGLVPANVAGQVQNLSTGGALSSLSNVTNRRLTLLFRDDGSTALTEAAAITSLGTAAAIAGQQAWATFSRPTATISYLADGGRVADPRIYNTQFMVGPRNVTNLVPTYTVGGSDVTVNLPAHDRVIAGPSGPVTLSYGAMSAAWPFSSYWAAYVDDPNLAGIASPTVTLTSNPNDLLYPGRYQVASGVTPSSGGSGGGTGGGGGGGGGWDNCVAAESFMPCGKFASEIAVGDMLLAIDSDAPGEPFAIACACNFIAEADCVEIVSASGIHLVLSASTPCTLADGTAVPASLVKGKSLAVRDQRGFRWEEITDVHLVGRRAVAHISIGGQTYAAGAQPGRFIFTHNGTAKP